MIALLPSNEKSFTLNDEVRVLNQETSLEKDSLTGWLLCLKTVVLYGKRNWRGTGVCLCRAAWDLLHVLRRRQRMSRWTLKEQEWQQHERNNRWTEDVQQKPSTELGYKVGIRYSYFVQLNQCVLLRKWCLLDLVAYCMYVIMNFLLWWWSLLLMICLALLLCIRLLGLFWVNSHTALVISLSSRVLLERLVRCKCGDNEACWS